jgi:hypothetical protein
VSWECVLQQTNADDDLLAAAGLLLVWHLAQRTATCWFRPTCMGMCEAVIMMEPVTSEPAATRSYMPAHDGRTVRQDTNHKSHKALHAACNQTPHHVNDLNATADVLAGEQRHG